MHRSRWIAGSLGAALLIAACGGGADDDQLRVVPGDEVPMEELSDADAAELATAVNAFGLDLHRTLAADGDNVVTSPLSVATLLAMVGAGAGGETADQMADVLHLETAGDDRFAALLRQVTGNEDATISAANALWADTGVSFEDDYLRHARDVFGATAEEAPLDEQSTADEIDAWVSEHTEGRIEEIAEDLGLPDPNAVLVLANTVYFLGEWTVPFDPDGTIDRRFTLTDGSEVDVPTMHRRSEPDEPIETAERDGYRLLRLPYGDDEGVAMEVYLPTADRDLTWLLDRLDGPERAAAREALAAADVEVALPRFELEWGDDLVEALTDLGMELPFSSDADFSAMSPAAPSLGPVVHKTYIRVDEKGTEAAAVTGGAMTTSLPPSFTVDRPFLFTITDTTTGTDLFVGTVEDPRG